MAYKGCTYLFNQIHTNIFLANSLEEPDVLLWRLERGNRLGRVQATKTKTWYGLSWPFGRRRKGYGRPLSLGKSHSRQSSDGGVVESVVKKPQ